MFASSIRDFNNRIDTINMRLDHNVMEVKKSAKSLHNGLQEAIEQSKINPMHCRGTKGHILVQTDTHHGLTIVEN
jgi:hypothetical protein